MGPDTQSPEMAPKENDGGLIAEEMEGTTGLLGSQR